MRRRQLAAVPSMGLAGCGTETSGLAERRQAGKRFPVRHNDRLIQEGNFMFANFRTVAARIQLGSALILVLAVAVIVPVVLGKIGSMAADSQNQTLDGHYRTLVSQIAAEARRAETLAVLLARVSEFQQAMANGQRERLGEMLLPTFAELKKNYAVAQMQYNTPPATSFSACICRKNSATTSRRSGTPS